MDVKKFFMNVLKTYLTIQWITKNAMHKWKKSIALTIALTKKPTFSYGWNEILVFSNSCAKCGDNKDKICKEEENIEMFKIIGLFENLNE